MDNHRILHMLRYTERHLKHKKFFISFRIFSENIHGNVEHVVNDLHDEGTLHPSEEMINLLYSMCTRVYDLSSNFLKNKQNEIANSLENILIHLINIRKFCLLT